MIAADSVRKARKGLLLEFRGIPMNVSIAPVARVSGSRRHWAVAVLGVVAVLFLLLAGARPAAAAVPHRGVYSNSTGLDSNNKGVSVSCPSGQVVVGAGADVSDAGAPDVVLDQLIPDQNSVSVYAYEYNSTNLNWRLRVWAVCDDFPTTPMVTRWSKKSGSSPVNRVVTATCPAGMVVYSTGWQIEGARGQVMVDHVIPTKTSVSVSAYEIDGGITSGYSGNWSLKAIARCGLEPGGRQIVTANTAPTSADKTGLVNCPSGKVPLGGGFEVHGLRDRILVNNLIINDVNIQTAAYELISISPGTWYIETYGICANP
jgi:hypothetical protein